MKILIISHEYPPIGGGGANACMYLSREYASAGHEVHIITVWYEGLAEDDLLSGFEGSIRITRLRAKRTNKEHCSFVEMFDFLRKALKVSDDRVKESNRKGAPFDICQIFFGIPSGPVGYRLKKKYGLPYVIRFGGGDIPGFQVRFSTVYKLIGPALKLIWKQADALVANSEGLRKLAMEFCNKYPIKVFPNGVDTNVFYPSGRRSYDKNILELLFISRLVERKGLQYIIPDLRNIEEASGKQIRFTIVGDGPYRGILEDMARKNEVSDMLTFVGQKDKDELLPYYQSGDIFVFPSKKEGMPNAVLEAMACGLPIVMSPCQGSEELIDGNGTIADADLTRFGESLLDVIKADAGDLQRMADCSRQRAIELFSWKSVADSYLGLFDNIRSQLIGK